MKYIIIKQLIISKFQLVLQLVENMKNMDFKLKTLFLTLVEILSKKS